MVKYGIKIFIPHKIPRIPLPIEALEMVILRRINNALRKPSYQKIEGVSWLCLVLIVIPAALKQKLVFKVLHAQH